MWLGERRTAANWDQEFAKSITMHHHRQVAFVFPVSMSSHTKQPTILSTSGQLLALFNLRNSKCLRGEWLIQRGLGVCKAPRGLGRERCANAEKELGARRDRGGRQPADSYKADVAPGPDPSSPRGVGLWASVGFPPPTFKESKGRESRCQQSLAPFPP